MGSRLETALDLPQIATPSGGNLPASGRDKLYFKSDEKLYGVSTGGIEVLIGPSAGSYGNLPVGGICAWTTTTAPAGFLLCDGSAVSRTTYAGLFAVIGTVFGSGDGSTTFNVPNLKGRAPVGYDSSQTEFDAVGETGGAKTHTLTTPEIPSHVHGAPTNALAVGTVSYFFNGSGPLRADAAGNTQAAGGGGAHNNLQPYIALPYIIRWSAAVEPTDTGWLRPGAGGGPVWGTGWADNGATTEFAAMQRIGTKTEVVGLVWRTSGAGNVIMTLPVGSRPGKLTYRPALISSNWAYVSIATNGDVSFASGGASPINNSNAIALSFKIDTAQP